MSTISRQLHKQQIIAGVRRMMEESGLGADTSQHKKALEDSLLSLLVMSQMMGFTRNDVIFALKDEWLRMTQLMEMD